MKTLKVVGNALARGICGLLFGYLIGVNLFGGPTDFNFGITGLARTRTLRTFAVVTAYLCGYGWWRYRWRKSPDGNKQQDPIAWRVALEVVAAGSAGVVFGYVIGLAAIGFGMQLVEDRYFGYFSWWFARLVRTESRIGVASALGMAALFVWFGWRWDKQKQKRN